MFCPLILVLKKKLSETGGANLRDRQRVEANRQGFEIYKNKSCQLWQRGIKISLVRQMYSIMQRN